jgi:formylmethanofuran dehydrogenase subunit E
VTEETRELETSMKDAAELHGHLGPFLVIGVRMGKAARQILNSRNNESRGLRATVRVPFLTPFSCILDGIQSATHCTIGNQRLRVKKSRQEITAQFETKGSDKILLISVNAKIVEELQDKMSKGMTSEYLAETIASTPEHQLFKFNVTTKRR